VELDGTTVLVTGATGFSGSFVARRLQGAGAEVRALVRGDAEVPGATAVRGDLGDASSLAAAVEGVDAVVHCAVAYRLGIADARRLTVDGTRALAEAALRSGCQRFVHLSTISVYDIRHVDVVDEATPLQDGERAELDPYGVSKAEAERALAQVAARGLTSVMLRPPAILGAHPRCSWTMATARDIARGGVGFRGDDSKRLPYLFVENLADAVVLALRQDAAAGRRYNVVDGHVPWKDYLERIAAIVGRPLEPDGDDPIEEDSHEYYDASLIRSELGYRPRVDYAAGMARIEAWLGEQDLSVAAPG